VDVGGEDGLEPGMVLEVVRGGEVVAVLRVEFVSSRRASCSAEGGTQGIVAGDGVRFLSGAAPAPREAGAGPAGGDEPPGGAGQGPSIRSLARDLGLRGRIGVRYLSVRDRTGAGDGISQPALDLLLVGTNVGGSPVGVEIDARSRRTYRTDAEGRTEAEATTNVYRLAASVQAEGSPWRATAGRQFSPSLSSVSIFDGVQGEYRAERWSLGAFSGTQPDPADLGYGTDVREHGGYVEWRNAPGAHRRWTLTSGLIGSYEQGEISREYSYLQGSLEGPRLGVWLTEEVDLNRGWKTEYESSTVALTSTFVSVRYRASRALSFRAGYDNRRDVRLYRDRVTPETDFDDQYRNGAWGGVEARLGGHFRAGAEVRTRGGGDLGGADSWTVTTGLSGLTRAGLGVATRCTRYTTDRVEGWLHSIGIGLSLGSRWHAEATAGMRDETSLESALLDNDVTWYGLDVDVSLGRGWFLTTSAERSEGDQEALDQIYATVSWRF
jgi:hypothetical protein